MTIITYKNNICVADDLCWEDNVIVSRCQKIFHRKKDGAIIGGVGDAATTDTFILKALQGRKLTGVIPESDNTTGIIARPDGLFETWDSEKHKVVLEADFYAIGAGSEIALGVMANGGSAVDAAITVCQLRGWPAILTVIDTAGNFTHVDTTQLPQIHIGHAPRNPRRIRR